MVKTAPDPTTLPDFDPDTLAPEPIERAKTLPSSWYVAPEFHRVDRHWVFARTWQYVGAAASIAEPGSSMRLRVAGEPLLVVRDADGSLRGFFDVCRHRGGPLVVKGEKSFVLKCRYHGWTYRLDGTLRGVPKWDRVELFDACDHGLVPVEVREWQGLVFVRTGIPGDPPRKPDAEKPDAGELDAEKPDAGELDATLAGIAERAGENRIDRKRFCRRVEYAIGCNWKVYVDNYLEGYHLPHVHPELCDLLDYQAYATEVRGSWSLQASPIRAEENFYGDGEGEALYWFVFPNFMINLLPGRLQTNAVLPDGPDRCRVLFDYYYDDVESESARRRIEEDVAYANRVQEEDIEICERVQEGLGSVAYDRGRLSVECETAVHHFQDRLKAAYREGAREAEVSPG